MLRLMLALLLLALVGLILLDRVSEAGRRGARAGPSRAAEAGAGDRDSPQAGNTRRPGLDSAARLSARIQLTSDAQRHYLDSLVQHTDSVIRRWPVTDAPIWFTLVNGGTDDFGPELQVEARAAIDAWSPLALGLRLLETADTAQATLLVEWTASLRERAGVTNVTWDRSGDILRARVTLATRDPGSGEPLSERARRAIALHEMGHALGLPHSAEPSDAMHPVTVADRPTDRDLNSIRLLYSLPTGWIGTVPGPGRSP